MDSYGVEWFDGLCIWDYEGFYGDDVDCFFVCCDLSVEWYGEVFLGVSYLFFFSGDEVFFGVFEVIVDVVLLCGIVLESDGFLCMEFEYDLLMLIWWFLFVMDVMWSEIFIVIGFVSGVSSFYFECWMMMVDVFG